MNESTSALFQSFFIGGFECATHRRRDGARIDVIAATGHDQRCVEDYRLLAESGIYTVRDGLRWHLIESSPGLYDWSSFLPMLHATAITATQAIWDVCHWGTPDGLDLFSEEFPGRFASFAAAAAKIVRTVNREAGVTRPAVYCVINEISFWSWVGGDTEHFYPYGQNRGPELKRQFIRASTQAIRAIRAVDPDARFLQAEPMIHISAGGASDEDVDVAARHTASRYETWDMLAGLRDVDLGGGDDMLDVIGVNYYWNNQWIHESDRTPPGHPLHRPLHQMLEELWCRYRRPIIISETGIEAGADVGWLGYVMAEVRQAKRMGVPVEGVCLYPVMDYPGWDDERHCPCGLIEVRADWTERCLRKNVAHELRVQSMLIQHEATLGR